MLARWYRARMAILLPLAALTLLLPMQTASASRMGRPHPNRKQIKAYKAGLEAWESALDIKDPQDRVDMLKQAERRFNQAAHGPGDFPEAVLGTALVIYTENDIIRAEPVFTEVAESTHGAMRSESLTYLGLIALRSQQWQRAKQMFEQAMDESLDDTTTSGPGDEGEELADILNERIGRLDCVARVGSILASFYAAQPAGQMSPNENDLRALLSEVDRLLAEAGKDEKGGKGEDMVERCRAAFNGTDAAIWRFPAPPTDWRLNLLDGPPAGVRVISLMEFMQAMRVWASAELAFEPPLPVPPAADLSDQDKHNLAAGLLKRALKLEAAGDFDTAFGVWEQLAQFPETAMSSRQHRIWIKLHKPEGAPAPSDANLNAARTLIAGPLAQQDELLFEEQLALASAIMFSATTPGPQMRQRFEQARVEFRKVLNGIPGVTGRTAPEYVRRIAEWNLAVLAISLPETRDPAYWERGLAEFPALPMRERIRLYMAMKLAEAYMFAKNPAQVEKALAQAEAIAAGREGPGSLPVSDGAEQLRLFRRYMAKLAFQLNEQDKYRQGFLKNTDFGGQMRAYEASELFRSWVANLVARPSSVVDAPSTWQKILQLLQDARTLTGGNIMLQQHLDADIKAAQAYLQALEQTPPRIFYAWNQAAKRTNTAKTPADWDEAAKMWRDVLASLQGRPADERAEAAMRVVNAYLRKADLLYKAMDLNGAKAALEQARDAVGVGPMGVGAPLSPQDREMISKRIENNLKALGAAEEQLVPAGTPVIPAYKGGPIGPCRARCVIVHYHERHQPDVADWLNRLQNNPDAVKRLVDWFNNGPMARATADAKRDFSADPNSPNYLVAFLSKHVNRTPGVLKRGARQWCDHNGAGPWHSYPVRVDTGAYYLTNGVAIINADCSNPLAPIRTMKPKAEWMECPEFARARELPQFPAVSYGMPEAEFSFHVEGVFQPYALPLPAVTPVPIIPPAISVLSVPEVLPKLHLPKKRK